MPDRRCRNPARNAQNSPPAPCRLLAVERVKYAPVTAVGAADALEHHARELRWLETVIPDLDRGLAR
jgi:hypothetical protein